MSKAFDTISHDILIHKLEHYGIRGICRDWFASYLTNRSQYTEINGHKSTYLNINTGVPQGSILGPILFLIYVNDINNSSNLNILCFADDTTAYKSGPNIKDLISDVNIQLQLLYIWLSCNKLSLNINKTSYTIFRPHSNTHINISNSLHKYVLPYAALRSLYFCLIRSRLQCAIEAWGNSNSLHKLQRVQKRAIRVINNKTNSDIIQILYLKETTF